MRVRADHRGVLALAVVAVQMWRFLRRKHSMLKIRKDPYENYHSNMASTGSTWWHWKQRDARNKSRACCRMSFISNNSGNKQC